MFRSSTPVTADSFLDREAELARLEALIERLRQGAPQWLAIVGVRKIGKTSLISELARRTDETSLRFVLLDAQEEAPVSLELFRLLALRAVDVSLGTESGTSFELLSREPAAYLAALTESDAFGRLPGDLRSQLVKLASARLDASGIRACLELPERLAQAMKLKLVIAIDEFQDLARLSGKQLDVFALMRSVWQRHKLCAYVISGSARSMLRDLVTARHSPFFQHFDLMELGPFSHADGLELLRAGSAGDRAIPPALAERAVGAIGTHPFYLQMLGESLLAQSDPLDEAALKAAVQALLFSRTGRLALYFESQFQGLVGRSTYLAALLDALADGPRRLSELGRAIGSSSGSTVRYVERLGDAIVHRADRYYELADPTFGLWLAWRRPGGSVLPMKLLGDEAELEVASELARMGFELIYQARASRGAFDLLAIRGSDQLGVQVKRGPLPVRFKKAGWLRMQADADRFGWRWVIAAVTPEGRCLFLEPDRARSRREVTLDETAAIENLLVWLSRH